MKLLQRVILTSLWILVRERVPAARERGLEPRPSGARPTQQRRCYSLASTAEVGLNFQRIVWMVFLNVLLCVGPRQIVGRLARSA